MQGTINYRTIINLKEHVKKYQSILTKKEIHCLRSFEFTSRQFYCLSKVHKFEIIENVIYTKNSEYIQVHCPDYLKGTPIPGGPESPRQRLIKLIETLLKSLVPTLKAF